MKLRSEAGLTFVGVSRPSAAQWLLVVTGDSRSVRSTFAGKIAAATTAIHVDATATGLGEVVDGLDVGACVVVESDAVQASETERLRSHLLGEARRRQVARIVIELQTAVSDDSGIIWSSYDDDVTTVRFDPIELSPAEVGAILRPVLNGPRNLVGLASHLDRRQAILALDGRPGDGDGVTSLIRRQLDIDARDEELMDRWWLSTIIDENTGGPVLERTTFDWIDHALADRERVGWPVSHAGLLHTYGYLLSTAWTPYGWKADRYLDGVLATLLGVGLDDLTPWTPTGTLLSNLTAALDRTVESDRQVRVVEEAGQLRIGQADRRAGTLRTRIFPTESGLGEDLLVYSIDFDDDDRERYVTTFPIGEAGVRAVLEATDCVSRYNVAAELLDGERTTYQH